MGLFYLYLYIHNQIVDKTNKSFEYVVNFKCLVATLIQPASMLEVKELTMFMECLTIRSIIVYIHICHLKINTHIYRTLILPLVLRTFKIFSLILKEKPRLWVFENWML